MDYGVVNNCLCSIEASLRALKFEVGASKAEESPSTDVQRLKAEIAAYLSELNHMTNIDFILITDVCYKLRQLSAV